MIDILIMDDSGIKVEALRHVITNLLPHGEVKIDTAPNIYKGRLQMQARQYDLLILDMVMPHHEDEEQSHTAGAEYLDEIYQNESIKVPLQVIGLTEYEEEFTQQQQDFRDKLWHLLFYSHKDTNWRKDLQQKLLQLHQFKKSLAESLENRSKYDVAIICTHAEEFEQMLNTFSRCQWDYMENDALPYIFRTATIHTAGLHELRIIATCTDKPGVCATSVLATALYTLFKVDTVFMVGSVSGLEKENHAEEHIVVAESIKGKNKAESPETANRSLLVKMSTFVSESDNPSVLVSLQVDDVEGYSLYYVSHTLDKKSLSIKSSKVSQSAKLLYDFIREMF